MAVICHAWVPVANRNKQGELMERYLLKFCQNACMRMEARSQTKQPSIAQASLELLRTQRKNLHLEAVYKRVTGCLE